MLSESALTEMRWHSNIRRLSSTPRSTPKINENIHPHEIIYANVHESIMRNNPLSLKIENNPYTYPLMDKQNVIYPYNGVLFSKEKELSTIDH